MEDVHDVGAWASEDVGVGVGSDVDGGLKEELVAGHVAEWSGDDGGDEEVASEGDEGRGERGEATDGVGAVCHVGDACDRGTKHRERALIIDRISQVSDGSEEFRARVVIVGAGERHKTV